MKMRIHGLTLIILSCIFCSGELAASPFWDANLISNATSEYLQLKDQQGKVYTTIKPSLIRVVIAAKNNVESAAGGISTHLWIDGEEKANAFATYNNGEPTIAINVGMLRALGEDEEAYAALLGHELAHLYLGHTTKSLQRNSAKNVGSMILGFVLGYAGVPAGGTIADITTTAISTVYSRDDERDADAEGIKYIIQAGYDPYGAVHMQEKLAAANSVISIPFLSTHPSSGERIKNMRQLAENAKSNQANNPVAGNPLDSTKKNQYNIASEPLITSNIKGAVSGSAEANCVGLNTKVGDNIRAPNGRLMTVKTLLFEASLRCTQPEYPIRAILEPSNTLPPSETSAFNSKVGIDLPENNEDITQKLRELKQLYLDEVISEYDYNKKRKQLIEKL